MTEKSTQGNTQDMVGGDPSFPITPRHNREPGYSPHKLLRHTLSFFVHPAGSHQMESGRAHRIEIGELNHHV